MYGKKIVQHRAIGRTSLLAIVGASIPLFGSLIAFAQVAAPVQPDQTLPTKLPHSPGAQPLGAIIHVDVDAVGANNGTSWINAYNDLQDALAIAAAGNEIWVADGTYTPAGPGGSRSASFTLINGVSIYGGFNGTETMLEQRVPSVFLTTLSGDLNGDDGPAPFEDTAENSFHVVTASGVNETAVFDGFTITGGNADGAPPDNHGAGIEIVSSSPTIANCSIISNKAAGRGGGVAITSGVGITTIRNCLFTDNHVLTGGGGALGIGTTSASVQVSRCVFQNNSTGGNGGAIHTGADPVTLTIFNSAFSNNVASSGGGAIRVNEGLTTLVNVELTNNTASNDNGGAIEIILGSAAITNCTISGNTATNIVNDASGGGIRSSGTLTVNNSVLWGNEDVGGFDESAQIHVAAGVATVSYSILQGGWSGAGVNNLSSDPLFMNPAGYDFRVLANSPAVDSGDNLAVFSDTLDIDQDSNIIEPTPLALGGIGRFENNPHVVDTGVGTAPIVDRGAYEVRAFNILYVDHDGLPGTGDWVNAYTNLQDALTESQANADTQIWVAAGTYYPDLGVGFTPGDRSATFQLRNHVEIYGGFAGNETDLSQRDVFANGVTLSGDLNGDDGPNFVNRADNSLNVVTASGTDNTARLDGGIYVVGGNANGNGPTPNEQRGGGCYNDGGDAYFFRVNFQDNQALTLGGNVYQTNDSDVTYEFCQFKTGAADLGGGMAIDAASASAFFYYSTIENNTAAANGGGLYVNLGSAAADGTLVLTNDALGGDGGGLYFVGTPPTTWSNSDIDGNYADLEGGGVRLASGSDITFDTCGFDANEAGVGGAVNSIGSDPTFTFCTFDGNTARFGGAIDWNLPGLITIQDSIFTNNVANNFVSAAAGAIRGDGDGVIDNCDFIQNSTNGSGGAIQFKGGGLDLRISNSLFEGNSATGSAGGGAIAVGSASNVSVATSTFVGNQATGLAGGGAIANATGCTLTLVNSRFAENSAFGGGAVNNKGTLDALNCAFSGNVATTLLGGALNQDSGNADIVNCTVVGNSATLAVGGGLATNGGVFNIRSSVLWNNEDNSGQTEQAQFFAGGGTVDVDYSLIQHLTTWTTPLVYVGNIDSDPQFVDADGLDNILGTTDDGFRIKPGSPAIDAGTSLEVPPDLLDLDADLNTAERTPFDLAGSARFYNDPLTADTGVPVPLYSVVDMGAFEFGGEDCNNNGIPDNCDLTCGAPNGQCDVPGCGQSVDLDSNGLPDECVGFITGCVGGASDDWSCFDNWVLPGDVFPDNAGPDTYDVELDATDTVFLDVDVTIDSLTLLDSSVLSITQTGPAGDLFIATEAGLTNEGSILISNGRTIDLLCGQVTVRDGNYMPGPGTVSGALECETLTILPGGVVTLDGTMSVDASISVTLDGTNAAPCFEDGGKTPPVLNVKNLASVDIAGNFNLIGNVSFTNNSSNFMNVGGDFDNGSTSPDCFDCSLGGMNMVGSAPQGFEVAGEDFGASTNGFAHPDGHTNYSMRTLHVHDNGPTNVVTFRNTRNNQVGTGACSEALYVHTLWLHANSSILLNNARVYYQNLIDEGATINTVGCGQLLSANPGCTSNTQCSDDLACTYDACTLGFCSHLYVEYGNTNGAGPIQPTLDDILCVLGGFANAAACPNGDLVPCNGGPGTINLDDILAVLGAFGGSDPCSCVP